MDIRIIDDFLSPRECELMIALALHEGMKPSQVAGGSGGVHSRGRKSEQCWLKHNFICAKIASEVNIPLTRAESLQVLHYHEGGKYNKHYDAWLMDGSDKSNRCLEKGQRTHTALLYLNTPDEGGQTEFPRISQTIEAREGRLVIWSNVMEGSLERNPLSEHAALPVLSGEKWACNLWFRQKVDVLKEQGI